MGVTHDQESGTRNLHTLCKFLQVSGTKKWLSEVKTHRAVGWSRWCFELARTCIKFF